MRAGAALPHRLSAFGPAARVFGMRRRDERQRKSLTNDQELWLAPKAADSAHAASAARTLSGNVCARMRPVSSKAVQTRVSKPSTHSVSPL